MLSVLLSERSRKVLAHMDYLSLIMADPVLSPTVCLAYYPRMYKYLHRATNPRHANGFTLLEIIVVVAIIGTIVAVVGVNFGNDTDRLARLEAQRFRVVVDEVRDEAIITGESYYLIVDNDKYNYFFEGVRANRNTSKDEGLFRVRTTQQGVALDWEVFEEFDEQEDERLSRVLISPLGEITSFDAWFEGKEFEYHVYVNDENNLERRTENASRIR